MRYRIVLVGKPTTPVEDELTVEVEANSLNEAIDKAETESNWGGNEETITYQWKAHCAEEIV